MVIDTKAHREYHHFPHYVGSCIFHVVFCPKYRRKVLTDKIAVRLKELVLENQEKHKYIILEMEVMPDHVHLLIDILDLKSGVYRAVSMIKGLLQFHLRQEFPELKSKLPTLWSRSKFIASVGSMSLDVVKTYIQNQMTASQTSRYNQEKL